jgi:uncharacterized membrane protein
MSEIFITEIIMGLSFILLGLPLYFKKVKPNSLYGFRTAKTRSSEAIWYPANQRCGLNLMLIGLVIIICSCAIYFSPLKPNARLEEILDLVLIVCAPLGMGLLNTFLYLKEL